MSSAVITGRTRPADWFYVVISGALLLLVVVGFSRTYYLRSVLGTASLARGIQKMPAHLHWRGLVLSAWFVLALVQPTLIASRRPHVHRLLGWAGIGLALAVARRCSSSACQWASPFAAADSDARS